MSAPPSHNPPLRAQVQEALSEAVYLACGYDISELKHCHVQYSSNFRNSGDMKTNVAAGIFLLHTSKNRPEKSIEGIYSEEEDQDTKTTPQSDVVADKLTAGNIMEVVTTSRYGLKHPRRYCDGKAVVV